MVDACMGVEEGAPALEQDEGRSLNDGPHKFRADEDLVVADGDPGVVACLPGLGEHGHVSDRHAELLARLFCDSDVATLIDDCHLHDRTGRKMTCSRAGFSHFWIN